MKKNHLFILFLVLGAYPANQVQAVLGSLSSALDDVARSIATLLAKQTDVFDDVARSTATLLKETTSVVGSASSRAGKLMKEIKAKIKAIGEKINEWVAAIKKALSKGASPKEMSELIGTVNSIQKEISDAKLLLSTSNTLDSRMSASMKMEVENMDDFVSRESKKMDELEKSKQAAVEKRAKAKAIAYVVNDPGLSLAEEGVELKFNLDYFDANAWRSLDSEQKASKLIDLLAEAGLVEEAGSMREAEKRFYQFVVDGDYHGLFDWCSDRQFCQIPFARNVQEGVVNFTLQLCQKSPDDCPLTDLGKGNFSRFIELKLPEIRGWQGLSDKYWV